MLPSDANVNTTLYFRYKLASSAINFQFPIPKNDVNIG